MGTHGTNSPAISRMRKTFHPRVSHTSHDSRSGLALFSVDFRFSFSLSMFGPWVQGLKFGIRFTAASIETRKSGTSLIRRFSSGFDAFISSRWLAWSIQALLIRDSIILWAHFISRVDWLKHWFRMTPSDG